MLIFVFNLTMSEDYQEAVLAYYNKRKEEPDFPEVLRKPTTAKIKKLCLKFYNSRYTPEADDVFSMFFDVDKLEANFFRLITKADVGDFRPLYNHLVGVTTTTEMKNSDLLAWLINFRYRPSYLYEKLLEEERLAKENLIIKEQTIEDISEPGDDIAIDNDPPKTNVEEDIKEDDPPVQVINLPDVEKEEQTNGGNNTIQTFYDDDKVKPTAPFKKAIIVGIVCLIVAGGSTLFWKHYNIQIAKNNDPNAKCMYWNDDHYERIACNETVDDATVTNVDEKKLANFKRIMIPDTLTKYALGKVWYTKINGKHQFFTDSGTHPVDTIKGLSPLTPYILYRYISYQRYLLIRLIWSFGGIMLFVFIGLSIRYFRRKALVKTIDAKVNTESFTPVGHLHQT